MKLPFLTALTCLLLLSFSDSVAQTAKKKNERAAFITRYLSVNPENVNIDELISTLKNNFELTGDTLIPKSAEHLLYYRGYSDNHNPFSFPISKLEIQVREGVAYTSLNNNIRSIDTLLTVQLIAIPDSSAENTEYIKSEFSKMNKQLQQYYLSTRFFSSPKKEKKQYAYYLYSDQAFGGYPLCRLGYSVYYGDKSTPVLYLETNYKMLIE